MELIKASILGLIEGVTEFLPISSTGHLIIVNRWISFDPSFTFLFDVVIQLGAILAVIAYFSQRLWPFGPGAQEKRRIWYKTIIGVLPALVLGALFQSTIERYLFNPQTVAIALVVGGIILILIEKSKRQARFNSLLQLPYSSALAIGAFQCLAMIPGTSRSAATIIGAMLLGASRLVAVEFSFFLAIPTMIAASAYSIFKHGAGLDSAQLLILATGFAVSFATALAVVRFFIRYIQTKNFIPFGYYRIAVGILVIILFSLI